MIEPSLSALLSGSEKEIIGLLVEFSRDFVPFVAKLAFSFNKLNFY